MRIKVKGKELYERISRMSVLLKSGTRDDYSKFIRFIVSGGSLTIHYFNGIVGVIDRCPGLDMTSTDDADFLVLAETFIPFLKSRKSEIEIVINEENKGMDILFNGGSLNTVCFSSASYPSLVNPSGDTVLRINSGFFVPALKKAFSFLETDDGLHMGTTRISMSVRDGVFDMVCTDRFKLYRMSRNMPDTPDMESLIARELADAIYGYFSDSDVILHMNADGRRIFFGTEDVTVMSLQVDEKFPDFRRVFDLFDPDFTVSVSRSVIKSVIDSLMFIKGRMVDFSFDGHALAISCSEPDKRLSLKDTVPFLDGNVRGVRFRTFMNSISSVVRFVTGNSVNIEYSSKRRVFRIYDPQNEHENTICSTLDIV